MTMANPSAPPRPPRPPHLITASESAQSAIEAIVGTGTNMQVPGWTFMARLNGEVFADVSEGYAVLPASGSAGVAMTHDSVIHLASCSKTICAAALVAMIEDIAALTAGIEAGSSAPTTSMTLTYSAGPTTVAIPTWLVPVFSGQAVTGEFLINGLLAFTPASVQQSINDFMSGVATNPTLAPTGASPAAQPGFVGMLRTIAAQRAGSTFFTVDLTCPYLTLIGTKLQATALELSTAFDPGTSFTLDQLFSHQTTLTTNTVTLGGIPIDFEPQNGGPVAFNPWQYMVALLQCTQATPGPIIYNNNNYATLSSVIAHCTAMRYQDYAVQRVLSDPRFSTMRPNAGSAPVTNYYGAAPAFLPGTLAADYTQKCGGAGGFSASASQYTDWIYALYSCDPTVQGWNGPGPILSSAGSATIFAKGATSYPATTFCWDGWSIDSFGWTSIAKTGGTYWGNGHTNVVGGVESAPNAGSVMVAFFGANGSINAVGPYGPGLDAAVSFYVQYGSSTHRVP